MSSSSCSSKTSETAPWKRPAPEETVGGWAGLGPRLWGPSCATESAMLPFVAVAAAKPWLENRIPLRKSANDGYRVLLAWL